jgi:hypothetical protein
MHHVFPQARGHRQAARRIGETRDGSSGVAIGAAGALVFIDDGADHFPSSILTRCGRSFGRSWGSRASHSGLAMRRRCRRLTQQSLRSESCFSGRRHGDQIFQPRHRHASPASELRTFTPAGGASLGYHCRQFRRTGTRSRSATCRSERACRSESTTRTRVMRTPRELSRAMSSRTTSSWSRTRRRREMAMSQATR